MSDKVWRGSNDAYGVTGAGAVLTTPWIEAESCTFATYDGGTSTLTFTKDGAYLVTFSVGCATGSSGPNNIAARILINGTIMAEQEHGAQSGWALFTKVHGVFNISSGDTLQTQVWIGGHSNSVNISASNNHGNHINIVKLP